MLLISVLLLGMVVYILRGLNKIREITPVKKWDQVLLCRVTPHHSTPCAMQARACTFLGLVRVF